MEEEKQENKPSEVEELRKKSEEYLNNWKRAAADMQNYKKEEVERAGLLVNYAKQDMIFKILPMIDSFYLAHNHIPKGITDSTWMQGFMQIQNQINDFLKKEGIETIEVVGKPFDPNTMEIVSEVEQEGQAPHTVVEELQKGYMLDGKVLRPAKVKVTK